MINIVNIGVLFDFFKSIEVINEIIVIIDGKKCVLLVNFDIGQLCVYFVVILEGMVQVVDFIIVICLCLGKDLYLCIYNIFYLCIVKRKRGRFLNLVRKNQIIEFLLKRFKKKDLVLIEIYIE